MTLRQSDEARRPSGALTWADWVLLALLCGMLLVLCVVRSRAYLAWADETFSLTILSVGFGKMLHGWNGGVDSGGLFFYLLGWPWFRMFGRSVLAMRLFSTACLMGSVVLVWRLARRVLPTLPVALAMGVMYLRSTPVLWQTYSGRFYGLMLLSTAFAALMVVRLDERERPGAWEYVGLGLSQGMLIGSQLLGMLYSGVLLVALVVLDRLRGRFRPRLYAAGLLGWSVLALSVHAFRVTTSVADKVFWTTRPGVVQFLKGAVLYNPVASRLMMGLVVVQVVVAVWRRRAGQRIVQPRGREFLAVAVVLASLYGAELVMFAKSQVGISIFADRYLIPLLLPAVVVCGLLLSTLLPRSRWDGLPRWVTAGVGVVLFGVLGLAARRVQAYSGVYPPRGYDRRFLEALPAEHTVVSTEPLGFTFFRLYDSTHRYVAMNDWTYDLAGDASHRDLASHRLIANWKKAGFGSDDIQDWDSILASRQSFALLVFANRQPWLRARLLGRPEYRVTRMATFPECFPFTIYDVRYVGRP